MAQASSSSDSAFDVAARATFEAFANCYLREIDPGAVREGGDRCRIEWFIGHESSLIGTEVSFRSLCGTHRFGSVERRKGDGSGWTAIEPLEAVTVMLREAFARVSRRRSSDVRAREVELLRRVLSSCQVIAENVAAAAGRPAPTDFISAERSIAFGHAAHPVPKSFEGVAGWQRQAYGPDSDRSFRLEAFSADGSIVEEDTAGRVSATRWMAAIAGETPDPRRPVLLMHPLQAQALLLSPEVEALISRGLLKPLGAKGPLFKATSSMRTVWSEDVAFMLKFSLPVRITNSLRRNRFEELQAGVAIARYFRRTKVLRDHPRLRVLLDTAFATIRTPPHRESGFETILRQNPFRGSRAMDVATVAALTGDPVPDGVSMLEHSVRRRAARDGLAIRAAARAWFADYLECCLVPMVRVYDETGIAFEAHQQNTVIHLPGGQPLTCYYRDNQGYYLASRYRERLVDVVPELSTIGGLFFDEQEVSDRLGYYLVVNQIFAIIARMGRDGLADEEALLSMLRRRLEMLAVETSGVGRRFCTGLLEKPTICIKRNLAARIAGVDELAQGEAYPLYSQTPNALHAAAAGFGSNLSHAVGL